MSAHGHNSCPNCKRSLTKEEIYCYFCEMDVTDLRKKAHSHEKDQGHGRH